VWCVIATDRAIAEGMQAEEQLSQASHHLTLFEESVKPVWGPSLASQYKTTNRVRNQCGDRHWRVTTRLPGERETSVGTVISELLQVG
jgi:hypothetical protein